MKLQYRITKSYGVKNNGYGLEKRFYTDKSGIEAEEVKFNSTIVLNIPQSASLIDYSNLLEDSISYKQTLSSFSIDHNKTVCRSKNRRALNCGKLHKPKEWVVKASTEFTNSMELTGYKLQSAGVCTHTTENGWHVELHYHKPLSSLPIILNLHVKTRITANASKTTFVKLLKDKISSVIPTANSVITAKFDELYKLTPANAAQNKFHVKPYNGASYIAPTQTFQPVEVSVNSAKLLETIINDAQAALTDKREFLDVLQNIDDISEDSQQQIKQLRDDINHSENILATHIQTQQTLLQVAGPLVEPAPQPPEFVGLELNEVPGDGSCFYHAVSHHTGRSAAYLRQISADYLEQHHEDYIDFFEGETDFANHLDNIRFQNDWANDYEIQALSMALNRPIVVISMDGKSYKQDILTQLPDAEPIFILFDKEKQHYDTLLVNGECSIAQLIEDVLQRRSLLTTAQTDTTQAIKSTVLQQGLFAFKQTDLLIPSANSTCTEAAMA